MLTAAGLLETGQLMGVPPGWLEAELMGTDRHRHQPLSVRLQGADREWAEAHAARLGISVRMVIADAVIEYRGRAEGRPGLLASGVRGGCVPGLGWPR